MTLPARLAPALLATVLLLFGSAPAQAASKPCKTTLGACPASGCEVASSPHGLMNKLKRTVPQGSTPTVLALDDFETLQEQADNLLVPKSQNVDLTAAQRAKLKNLAVPSGATVSEGSFVEVQAFLVGLPNRPAANTSGESVNCRIKGTKNNDFHIPIARRWTQSEFQGVVVEMIPQDRPGGWSLVRLHAVAEQGRQVRIRGGPFYDSEHFVNDDPDNPKGSEPKRFSLWEIHPITEFLVCKTAKKVCDRANENLWQKIEDADGLE
jgi:hypothetical protein